MSSLNILLLGTCDTKLEELLFLRTQILSQPDTNVTLLDVGRSPIDHEDITIPQPVLLERYGQPLPSDASSLSDLPRGELMNHLSVAATDCVKELYEKKNSTTPYHGIICAGGSGNTTLAATVMRNALPIGFPKFIVSTVASGDTGPMVGETDITLMYSVVDVAGLNSLLRQILTNAAAAVVGMANGYRSHLENPKAMERATDEKPVRIGITMFGVTTPAVDRIRTYLTTRYPSAFEIYVFHATGHGGRAMERLIIEGRLDAVIDLTTTEICDFIAGGNMSAGPQRLDAALKAGIPNIISLGATDMVNFGPRETVPERYGERRLYVHNSAVTLMRTDREECVKVGEFIVGKLRGVRGKENVRVIIPEGGVSMLSVKGGAFEDRDTDGVLFKMVKDGLRDTGVLVESDDRDVNDNGFAERVADALVEVLGLEKR